MTTTTTITAETIQLEIPVFIPLRLWKRVKQATRFMAGWNITSFRRKHPHSKSSSWSRGDYPLVYVQRSPYPSPLDADPDFSLRQLIAEFIRGYIAGAQRRPSPPGTNILLICKKILAAGDGAQRCDLQQAIAEKNGVDWFERDRTKRFMHRSYGCSYFTGKYAKYWYKDGDKWFLTPLGISIAIGGTGEQSAT